MKYQVKLCMTSPTDERNDPATKSATILGGFTARCCQMSGFKETVGVVFGIGLVGLFFLVVNSNLAAIVGIDFSFWGVSFAAAAIFAGVALLVGDASTFLSER